MVQRPRRNRVTPFGTPEAVPARGQLMGNRGDLHDRQGEVSRDWKVKRWIACRLTHPRGTRVTFDTPGRYTPLFFADEPTALAAGHRPCAECRRVDYEAYREGWRRAFGLRPSADQMDATLHAARIGAGGEKITVDARLGELPDGAMVTMAPDPAPLLLWNRQLFAWSHEGYGPPRRYDGALVCRVLTPMPSVAVLAALASEGLRPWPGFAAPLL